jgi:hypothetical protein
MSTQPSRKARPSLISAALALTLVGVCSTPPTFAGVALNTIDPVALVTGSGRHILVTGPIACMAGEQATLRVTVTQRATGAVAQGRTRLTCTGNLQHWEVRVASRDTVPFWEGSATAVALARTTAHGEPTDAHQWVVDLMLGRQ